VWTNRLFTSFRMGRFGYGWPMAPAVDWHNSPPRIDLNSSIETGAGWLSGSSGGPFSFDRNKPQVDFTASYFLPDKAGSHDFKFGYEYMNDQSIFGNNGNSGPILYRDRSGQPSEIRVTDLGTFDNFGKTWTPANDRDMHHSLFAQDRWRMGDRLTLTLGLRYDYQRPHYEASIRDPVLTEIFPATDTSGKTLFTSNVVAPRVGASYDVMGDGKSVLKAFWGRFYFNYADSFTNANPGGTNYQDRVFNDLNGNMIYDGPQELGAILSQSGGSSTSIDPNLKIPYTDEFDVSYDRQF
jgi:outer membrane receptor protein involved in Fe transport